MKRKLVAILLSLLMVLSSFPVSFANYANAMETAQSQDAGENPEYVLSILVSFGLPMEAETKVDGTAQSYQFRVLDRVSGIAPLTYVQLTAEDIQRYTEAWIERGGNDDTPDPKVYHVLFKALELNGINWHEAFEIEDDTLILFELPTTGVSAESLLESVAADGNAQYAYYQISPLRVLIGETGAEILNEEAFTFALDDTVKNVRFMWQGASIIQTDSQLDVAVKSAEDILAREAYYFTTTVKGDGNFRTASISYRKGTQSINIFPHSAAFQDTENTSDETARSLDPRDFTDESKISQHVYRFDEAGRWVELSSAEAALFSLDSYRPAATIDASHEDNHLKLLVNSDMLQPSRYFYLFRYDVEDDQNPKGTRVSDPLIIDVVDRRPSRKPIEAALEKAPDPGSDTSYYHENDGYGPLGYLGKGESWWANYLKIRSEVEQAQYDEEAEVLQAAERIEKAVKALISRSSVNATSLYDKVTDLQSKYADESSFDSSLIAELKSVLQESIQFVESLYDADGNPSSKNNQMAYAIMSRIFQRLDEIETKLDAAAVAPPENISLEAIAGMRYLLAHCNYETMSSDAYQEGWDAFVAASKQAKHVLDANGVYDAKMTPEMQKEQINAFLGLHRAYHRLVEKKEQVRVRLFTTDNAMASDLERHDSYPSFAKYKELFVPSGTTIKQILEQEEITLSVEGLRVQGYATFKDLDIERQLFLNGMPLANLSEKGMYYESKKDYVLKDGDVLLVAQYVQKLMPENQMEQEPYSYYDEPSWVKYLYLDVPENIMAGQAFTIQVKARPVMFPHYTTELKPYQGATIITSYEADEADGLDEIPLVLAKNDKTDAEGNVTITLEEDGWYLLNAFDLEVEEGQYVVGPSVLVYAESPQLKETIEEYKQKIREVSRIDTLGEEQYPKAEWDQLKQLLVAVEQKIESAQTLSAVKSVYKKAVNEIEEFVALREKRNKEDLPRFRAILDQIPKEKEKLGQSHGALIEELQTIYNRLPRIIWEKLTAIEIERYQWLLSMKDALPDAKEYAIRYELVVEGVPQEDRVALQNMVAWLQEHTTTEGRSESGTGGRKLAELYSANSVETIGNWNKEHVFTKKERFLEGSTVAFNLSPEYASHFHIRGDRTTDKNGKPYGDTAVDNTLQGKGWAIEDISTGSGNFSFFHLNAKRKYFVNGKEYQQVGYEIVGLGNQSDSKKTYDFYDFSDYKGKESYLKLEIKDAFGVFTMPNNDVTVRIKWRPVAGTDSEIRAERESSKFILGELFQGYQKEKDAYGLSWSAIEAIYRKAIQDIDQANDINVIAALRREAIAAMSAVKKETSDGNPDLPNLGNRIGRVHVTIENSTFLEGNFTGIIFEGWVDLEENDTMMTMVLKALKMGGFSWNGTGSHPGVPEGYDITYLSDIYKDLDNNGKYDRDSEKKLGEFDGGPQSGWMGTLNDWYTNEGFQAFGVKNKKLISGDEIHVQYTQELGRDIGGEWGAADTSLKSLEIAGGKLEPNFDGGTTDYILTIRSEKAVVTVNPVASNKNYLVRTFLNHYNSDAAHYRRKDQIPVKVGDIIYVGCGDRSWPSMNKQGKEATEYSGTIYKIRVARADAAGLQARIDVLKEVRFSNYKQMKAFVTELMAEYEALSDKSKVNISKLLAAKSRIEGFEEVERVKALLAAIPPKSRLTTSDKSKVEQSWQAYEALKARGEGFEKYITYVDTLKYNDAIAWLKSQRVDLGTTQVIEGSRQAPVETDENLISLVVEKDVVKAEVLKTAFQEALNKKTELVLPADLPKNAKQLSLKLPGKELQQFAKESKVGVLVETNVGELKISPEALKTIVHAGGGDVEILLNKVTGMPNSIRSDATALEVEIKVGNQKITKFGGMLELLLPVDAKQYRVGKDYKIMIISGDGSVSKEKAKVVKDQEKGTCVSVQVNHLSTFIVLPDRALHFVDVEGHWAEQNIAYVYDAGIMKGMNDVEFRPNAKLTRAMFITMLYRLASTTNRKTAETDVATHELPFVDVEAHTWYSEAVEWARKLGITDGIGNRRFGPNQEITREQMVAFLYRYVRSNKEETDMSVLADFKDAKDVGKWAKATMVWAVKNGLIEGNGAKSLLPKNGASRAESATVIMRFIKNEKQNWVEK